MRPTDQTVFGARGNCMLACIASILECPLDDVPDIGAIHDSGGSWPRALNDWLRPRGLAYIEVKTGSYVGQMPRTYHIIGGVSPRGFADGHAVVGYAGQIVHDPHPSRAGLTSIEDYGFFVRLFPRYG